MSKGFATQKVPGGKLLQIEAECTDGIISSVSITGDFFLHPEEAVTDLEACFSGMRSDSSVAELIECVERVVTDQKLILVGVSPSDLAATVIQALAMCNV